MAKTKGLFITVDGPNGVGKSSLVEGLANYLHQLGIDVLTTTEPTNSALGSMVRKMESEYQGCVYACLVAADRYFHIETEVIPALQNGRVVLSSRFVASSLVLQRLDNVDLELIWAINSGICMPDINIILTASAAILEQRLAQRSVFSRFERTTSRSLELSYYLEAAEFLSAHGFNVWLLENGETPLENNVLKIGKAIVRQLNLSKE